MLSTPVGGLIPPTPVCGDFKSDLARRVVFHLESHCESRVVQSSLTERLRLT
jgi:hypothetical protein